MKKYIVIGQKLGGTIEGIYQDTVFGDLIVWKGTSI